MSKDDAAAIIQEIIDEMCDDCHKNCKRCQKGQALLMAVNMMEDGEE